MIERAVRGPRAGLARLCGEIAARVAGDPATIADVVAIRIVTGTHDAVEYLVAPSRRRRDRAAALPGAAMTDLRVVVRAAPASGSRRCAS